jgi:hypothetical protein
MDIKISKDAIFSYYYRPHLEILQEGSEIIECGGVKIIVRNMGGIYTGMLLDVYEALNRGEEPPKDIKGRQLDERTYVGSDGIVVMI